jgi:branched-chain amino acid transport system permease protein
MPAPSHAQARGGAGGAARRVVPVEEKVLRRAVIAFAIVLAGVLLGASPAWAEGEAVQGTLKLNDEPVADVTITVFDEGGDEVGSAVSGDDGTWTVSLPGEGTYRVELDESTLPQGVVVRNGRPSLTPTVAAGQVRNVLFPLGTGVVQPNPGESGRPVQPPTEGGGSGQGERLAFIVYGGLHFGLIIALAALGLSLIYGTTGLTNFAHGELVTFGAVMGFLFNVVVAGWLGTKVPLIAAAAIAVALGGLFGWLQDKFFWSWLRRRGTGLIAMMIVSIGVALMLRFAFLYFVGGQSRRYNEFVVQEPLIIGPLIVTPKTLVTSAISIVVLVLVSLALVFTRLGTATRAVADNPALAASSGVPVNQVVRLVWAVGGALAALSGVILAVENGVDYQLGQTILLVVFAAVVLGGLGTAFGALLGSLIIGLFIELSTLVIPNELKYVGALAVLVVILLVRPQGLLGQRERIG